MPHLSDFLRPEAVSLSLISIEKEAMLQEVLHLLCHDRRITNWQEFSNAILQSSPFPLYISQSPLAEPSTNDAVQRASNAERGSAQEAVDRSSTERTLHSASAVELSKRPTSVVIYHARTNATQDLIMSVGRSQHQSQLHQKENFTSLIFVIGIPHALSNEYLRIIGAIARACQTSTSLERLLTTKTPEELIAFLAHKNCL